MSKNRLGNGVSAIVLLNQPIRALMITPGTGRYGFRTVKYWALSSEKLTHFSPNKFLTGADD